MALILHNISTILQQKNVKLIILIYFNIKAGLDTQKLIGIATDTCATMTSPNCGAFISLKKKIPHLVHLLCLNHSSNLSLLLSFKSSQDVVFAMSLLSDLKCFFRMSTKRDTALKQFLTEKKYSKLLDLCATRWSEAHNSISRILDCYEEVYLSLLEISKWGDRSTSQKANELVSRMESMRTIYSLCTLNWITVRINPLVKTLQNSASNHIESSDSVLALIQSMRNQSTRAYEQVYERASGISNSIGIPFRGNRLDLLKGMPLPKMLFTEIFKPAVDILVEDLEKRYYIF